MFYCRQVKSVALTDYIFLPYYSSDDPEVRMVLAQIAGRPVAVEAVKAMILNNTTIEFDDKESSEYYEIRSNREKVSTYKSSVDGITTIIFQTEIIEDMFLKGDNVKFMEILRRKLHMPLMNEWADGILELFTKERIVRQAISNVGEYYIFADYNNRAKELIADFMDSFTYDGDISEPTDMPTSISEFTAKYKNELSKMILDKCDVLYVAIPFKSGIHFNTTLCNLLILLTF